MTREERRDRVPTAARSGLAWSQGDTRDAWRCETRTAPCRGDTAERFAWQGLLVACDLLRTRLGDALRDGFDLSLTEYQVLGVLSETPKRPSTTTDLARAVSLSVSGLSRLIDRLLARDLVTKQTSAGPDARSVRLAVTTSGSQLYAAAAEAHRARVRALFFDKLTVEEVRVIARVCASVCGR